MRTTPAIRRTAAVLATLFWLTVVTEAKAFTTPYIGQIMCGGFNFAPSGWARLEGQLLPIDQNDALFALIGTTYGGNGQTTFALPDLRGRFMKHSGQGPALPSYTQGQTGGAERVTLSPAQLPAHTHTVVPLASTSATQGSPAGAVHATVPRTTLYAPGPGTAPMQAASTTTAGNAQAVEVMPPYTAVNCFIALVGIFPSPARADATDPASR